ncbi:hypothetical protein [Brevundimonas nasdae]|uniref:Uncharacterized protein n=1 Tax=Brevundimonas nasdae TaxID=172043 RepID=A0ACD4VKX0_9CAUL|nr:hypothetical protein [Brevundimonas nasdae]WOB78461.1 hypothetical protein PZA08_14325 [Brevundimonas nasdae]
MIVALLSFLGAIAWPIAVCLLVWWFREPLKAKLNDATTVEAFGVKLLLADALEKAKRIQGYADIRVEPDAVAAQGTIDQNAEDAPTVPPTVVVPTPSGSSSFERIAAVDPRSAIQYLWSDIEGRVLELARVYGLPVTGKNLNTVLKFLDASGVIPVYLTPIINDLRSVRNSAVHARDVVDFTLSEALRFRDAGKILIAELDELIERGDELRHENEDGI